MDPDFTCYELSADHLVLELHERITAPAPALELHVVREALPTRVVAWWVADNGKMVALAPVAAA